MNSRSLGLLAGSAALAFASIASAADLPARYAPAAPYAAVPVFTWTGFYVGAHAGYGWAEDEAVNVKATESFFDDFADAGIPLPILSLERDGFLGGGQIGFNYQMGSIVAGFEADLSWMDSEGAGSASVLDSNGYFFNSSFTGSLAWLATARARLGFAFDRVLVYGTAGLAFGDVNYDFRYVYEINDPDVYQHAQVSEIKAGYALGAGVEYAFTNNLTFKGEYLFYDLGASQMFIVDENDPYDQITYKTITNGHIARVGVNYKF